MPKILILCSKTGGGHVSLAEALRDQLTQDFAVEIVDPQPRVVHWHYRMISRHALWLWAAEFKAGDTLARSLFVHKVSAALFAPNLASLLRRSQPDAVISTYPFLTYEVVHAMHRSRLRRPFVMLFADPNGVHQAWLTERGAAATFAPTRETYAQALAAGFAPERLHLTGWPVRGQFSRCYESIRAGTLGRLGLRPDRFTVFLQGGGEGAAGIARSVENLLPVPGIQIILAAGTHKALAERFATVHNLRAVAFTKEVAPFMAAPNVVMGKVGPNMLFESVTLGKPFIATAYIPGQEQVNLEFIRRHQLGWVALTATEQGMLVQSLATDATRLRSMADRVSCYRRWNAEARQTILPLMKAVAEGSGVPSSSGDCSAYCTGGRT
jgi:processive 1,2-diacylglycerol beta-glucosyltransferase